MLHLRWHYVLVEMYIQYVAIYYNYRMSDVTFDAVTMKKFYIMLSLCKQQQQHNVNDENAE